MNEKEPISLSELLKRNEEQSLALAAKLHLLSTKLTAATILMEALAEKLKVMEDQLPSNVKRLDLAITDTMAPARDKFGKPDLIDDIREAIHKETGE